MVCVKNGTVTRKRRKKALRSTRGYYGSKHTLFKSAKEQVMSSHYYTFKDHRQKEHDFCKLWVVRISAATRMNSLSYSRLVYSLKLTEIDINRKMLADLAANNVTASTALAEQVKDTLSK